MITWRYRTGGRIRPPAAPPPGWWRRKAPSTSSGPGHVISGRADARTRNLEVVVGDSGFARCRERPEMTTSESPYPFQGRYDNWAVWRDLNAPDERDNSHSTSNLPGSGSKDRLPWRATRLL